MNHGNVLYRGWLRADILDECQNYLGGGGRFGWEKIGDCEQSKKLFAKKNPRPGKNTLLVGDPLI